MKAIIRNVPQGGYGFQKNSLCTRKGIGAIQQTPYQLSCSVVLAEFLILKPKMKFCHKEDNLTPRKFGVGSNMSCFDAIIKITEFMCREVDQN